MKRTETVQERHFIISYPAYGYANVEGRMVIMPEKAAVFKRILWEYLEGGSLVEICKELESDSMLTRAYREKWRPKTVYKIFCNEKYMGDPLLQKTYTTDFMTKKKVLNNGIAPQYDVEKSHEAIILKDIFRGDGAVGKLDEWWRKEAQAL